MVLRNRSFNSDCNFEVSISHIFGERSHIPLNSSKIAANYLKHCQIPSLKFNSDSICGLGVGARPLFLSFVPALRKVRTLCVDLSTSPGYRVDMTTVWDVSAAFTPSLHIHSASD